MKHFKMAGLAVLAVSALMVIGQPSFAAPAGKMAGRPGAMRAHKAQVMRKIGEKLNLTADQKARIKSIREDARRQFLAVRDDRSLTPEAKRARILEIRKSTREQISRVLTPEQREKAKAMLREAKGRRMARLGKALGLTPEQKARIKPILQDAKRQVKAVREDKSLTPEARKARIKEIRKSTREQISRVLTPEQRQKLDTIRSKHGRKHA